MSLKFPYKKFPLSDGGYTYSAVLNVNLALPIKNAPRTKRFEAVIDSGASRCVFHASIGSALGLDIEAGEIEDTLGITGPSRTYVHEVCLYVPGGVVTVRAAFSNDLPIAGLLGMNGFFENFNVVFDPTAQRVELERIFLA